MERGRTAFPRGLITASPCVHGSPNEAQGSDDFLEEVSRIRDVMLAETHEWLVSLRFRGPVLPA